MILVLGETGLLAQALRDICAREGRRAEFIGRAQADLTASGRLSEVIAAHDPACVVNAAAYTAVDRAETEREAAFALNERTPREAARICAARDIPMVHVSTDYVFDGAGDPPYAEDAPPNPLNVYGESKLAGERAVSAAGARVVILRTSWVMGPVSRNFIATMLRLARTRDEITVVADQRGRPTLANDLAQACLDAADELMRRPDWRGGLFHAAGPRDAVWSEIAEAVMAEAGRQGLPTARIAPTTSQAFGAAAKRPLDSRLDSTAYEVRYGRRMRDLFEALPELVSRINALI